jgi:hypothetical protein
MSSRGPLDELLRGAGFPSDEELARIPRLPVHARVLELPTPAGRVRALAVWEDPGSPTLLHQELRSRIEGSLLGELAASAAELVEDDVDRAEAGGEVAADHPAGLHLVAFDRLERGPEAVAAFGLRAVSPADPALRPTVAALRHEARLLGLDFVPEDPSEAYAASLAAPTPLVRAVEGRLRREGVGDLWGLHPGAPAQRLLSAIHDAARAAGTEAGPGWALDPEAPPTPATIDEVEAFLVPRVAEAIRWIPPMAFQGLCDLCGVVASRALGKSVEWGVCAPPGALSEENDGAGAAAGAEEKNDDDDDGFVPPPVVRFRGAAGEGERWRFVDLGREVLRWCVMPLAPEETPPGLGAWVADVFR